MTEAFTLASITGTGTVSVLGTVIGTEGLVATRPGIVHSFVLVGGTGSGTSRLHNGSNATVTAATMAVTVAGTNAVSPDVINAPVVFNLGIRCIQAGTGIVAHVIFE